MSDPAKSTDIEDVLASIRRMVSADSAGSGGREWRERLILTPALRVGLETKDADRDVRIAGADRPAASTENPAGQPDAGIVGGAGDPVSAGASGEVSADEAGVADEMSPSPDMLEARIARLEATLSPTGADAGPGGEPERDPRRAEPGGDDLSEDGGGKNPDRDTGLRATVDYGTAVSGDTADPFADTRLPIHAAPAQETQTVGGTSGREIGPTKASLPADQDALRSVIAEVIREELRGETGERMSSNVRRLVRREVMRALAAQDGS